jgi:hypothetical protein
VSVECYLEQQLQHGFPFCKMNDSVLVVVRLLGTIQQTSEERDVEHSCTRWKLLLIDDGGSIDMQLVIEG